jgi:hypothetical protein
LLNINVRENRRGNQEWTIRRNWQHRVHKTKKNKTKTQHNMCWTPLYVNNVNKTWATLQTTGGKDEPNIVFVRTLLEVKGYYFVCNSWLITIRYSPTISRVSTGRNYGSHELFISHIKAFWLFPNNYITANQLIFTLMLSTLSNFCLCCWTIAPRGYHPRNSQCFSTDLVYSLIDIFIEIYSS